MLEAYYSRLIPENVAPKNAKSFIVRHNGEEITRIALGNLAQPKYSKLYSFCALSDVHIPYDTASTDFQNALTYVESSDCLFTCVCGDLTSDGNASQLSQYKAIVDSYAKTKPVYAIAGNHEFYSNNNGIVDSYIEKPLYYTFNQGNDVFIMVGHAGDWTAGNQFTAEELQWLYETLESNRNKRCFVFCHVFPYKDGVGNAGGLYTTDMWTSTKGTVFENLMKHYKNTALFHGHSHLRFDLQTISASANYSDKVGYRSIHISSITVPRDLVDGSMTAIYAESEGYIVDVYDDFIVLNGRDFIDNDADGHIIPLATYKIDTKLVDVPANTFVDNTGTIKVA